MDRQKRSSPVFGIVLILLGVFFLGRQLAPELFGWIPYELTWPWIIIGIGVFFLLMALLGGIPGMAVPGSILIGLGGLFYWQNATGDWASWAYAWTLIPGFVGVGVILEGLLAGRFRQGLNSGGILILISAIGFAIFSSLMGAPTVLGTYWPVLLIFLGGWVLVQAFFLRK